MCPSLLGSRWLYIVWGFVHCVMKSMLIWPSDDKPFSREVMCRLRGFLILANSGPSEPLRILITAADANEGNFPQGQKKIHAEQIKSDDSMSVVAF